MLVDPLTSLFLLARSSWVDAASHRSTKPLISSSRLRSFAATGNPIPSRRSTLISRDPLSSR